MDSTYYQPKLTKAGQALAERLRELKQPVITRYALFHELRALYMSGRKLRLRKAIPEKEDFNRIRQALIKADVLVYDKDYTYRAYQIVSNGDRPAEEICCLVDPFCYISHLSAMARYGLTNRRPHELHLTAPDQRIWPKIRQDKMEKDYGHSDLYSLTENTLINLQRIRHPNIVRNQPISVFETSYLGDSIVIRGTFSRLSTIGQSFVDMLDDPGICGGMSHVIEIWNEYASLYIEDIIDSVDKHHQNIKKIRAGYNLDELLKIKDERIQYWTRYAQRGRSRVLDPSKPFSSTYSEKWMISLNVI